MNEQKPLLEIKNLCIDYITKDDISPAVRNVSFSIAPGEVFGLAGESGCGKSTIAFAIARLTQLPGLITDGEIWFDGNNVLAFDKERLRQYRWAQTSVVFQSAMDSLNPVTPIAEQICDAILAHRNVSNAEALTRAKELLELVEIDPDRIQEFPHQFSGGMRQRIGIALALALNPRLIIMDEPTTALDVVVQRDILHKIYQLKDQFGFSVLFISHDLSMMAEFADRIGVMKEGRLLEVAASDTIWHNPTHSYTRQLAEAFLSLNQAKAKAPDSKKSGANAEPVLVLDKVAKSFKTRKSFFQHKNFRALDNVSFTLHKGRALALVGESGSGKSTCARILSKVYQPSSGEVIFKGKNVWESQSAAEKKAYQKAVQMIFQDPFGSLNPTLTVGYQLQRPLEIHHQFESQEALQKRIYELLDTVGLLPVEDMASRYPHELSGGQRQRVAIARALAIEPEVILADEPTSMLDVSLRTGILNLLQDLKKELDIAFLYITHDIATACYFAEDIAVIYGGVIVEWGDAQQITTDPQHPYTRLLLESVPDPERRIAERIAEGRNPLRDVWDPKGKGCIYARHCGPEHSGTEATECNHHGAPAVEVGPNHFIRQFDMA